MVFVFNFCCFYFFEKNILLMVFISHVKMRYVDWIISQKTPRSPPFAKKKVNYQNIFYRCQIGYLVCWNSRSSLDAEQVTQSNFFNHIKTLVHIGPMVMYKNGTQGLGPSKSLLAWQSWRSQSKLRKGDKILSSFTWGPYLFSIRITYFIFSLFW